MKSIAYSPQSIVAFLIFSCFVSSCKHNTYRKDIKDPSIYFTNFFTADDEYILRGVNFNATQEEIKKTEKSKLYESTTDHLFYEFSFPKDSTQFSEYANVQYFFNENNQLDIITSDIFLNDSVQEEHLKNTLVEYYNQRYGKTKTDDYDYDVWYGNFTDNKANKKYKYTIALKELTDDYGVKLEYMRE